MPLPAYHFPVGPRTLPTYRLPTRSSTLPGYHLPIPDGSGGVTYVTVTKVVYNSFIRVAAHFALRPGPGALAGVTGGMFALATVIGVAAS